MIPTGKTLKRVSACAILFLLAFSLLLGRIFLIQLFGFGKYQQKVLDQMTTESPVLASRGEILDANGRVLASNRTAYRISLFPNVIAKCENREAIASKIAVGLSMILQNVSREQILKHISYQNALERTVSRNVSPEKVSKILDFINQEKLYEMLKVDAVTVRYYPYGDLASHTLGFTGSEGQGLYGLELQYNKELSGINGSYITARDSMGNEMPNSYEAYIPAVDGNTLHTTLDAYVQSVLEEELESAMIESGAQNRVCGVVMNVNTGAILAMATGPSFDLNTPFSLNEQAMQELAALGFAPESEEYKSAYSRLLLEMWSNKALTEIYMPGSTFKALTCSMVLEEGAVIDLNERFFCSGALQVGDRTIHCHKKGGHGSITFEEGLQNSCNPVMMTIAARVGCDKFYEYVKAFGLLEKTGIDLPGEGNSIFHSPGSFTSLDLATASFGQNFKISVLQLMCAISAVSNGGELITPYLVESVTDANGKCVYQHTANVRRNVVSEKTAQTVSKILAEGVAGNGGAKNAYVAGYRVAAKTGTSEKIGDDANARIGSCVAFAPADAPEIAVIIVVDEPSEGSKYGSVVAAPYVGNVMERILPYLGVAASYTSEEEAALSVHVPHCVGWSADGAVKILEESGLEYRIVGEGDTVCSQMPASGTTVLKKGALITLQLGSAQEESLVVPKVEGLSAEEANVLLHNSGFNVQIYGAKDYLKNNKNVMRQVPSAGVTLSRGSVVKLYFEYDEMIE